MTVSTAVPLVQCNLSAREPLLRTPKATLVTEYALAGRQDTLLVINIHAVNFTLGLGAFEAQLGSPLSSSRTMIASGSSGTRWTTCTCVASTSWRPRRSIPGRPTTIRCAYGYR